MAPPEAKLAAAAGDVEEAAAPLVPGSGARRASASAASPRDVHLLSSAFLFVFLAYHAAQNLQSTVNTDENLGSISLGVLYTSFTAFSAVGSAVVRWMGSRRALVVGTSGYLLFIAANLAPSWYTMVPASLYLGFTASIIWVGQGLQQAFVWAVFTKSIVTPVLGISGVGGAMAIYGAADVVCSLIAGRLTSGLHSAASIVSVGAILQAVVLFWLLLFYSPMSGLLGAAIPLFIGALWGVGDGVLNTQLSALLGLLFEDVKEAAFAQLKVWQSGAIAVIFFLSPNITLQAMLILMTTSLFISFGSFMFLTLVVEKSSTVRP